MVGASGGSGGPAPPSECTAPHPAAQTRNQGFSHVTPLLLYPRFTRSRALRFPSS